MRHNLLGLGIGTVVALAPAVASASFHLMKVSEVLLSDDGDDTVQYVELVDSGEPFPAQPYSLDVYDAAGTLLGSVTLTNTSLKADQAAYYIGTAASDAKFGKVSDAQLTVALPANGTVCYSASSNAVHCLAYGTVTHTVMTGESTGVAPQDSVSLQRTPGGSTYFLGAPSPKAPNVAPVPDAGVQMFPDAAVAPIDAPAVPDAFVAPPADGPAVIVPDAATVMTPDAKIVAPTPDAAVTLPSPSKDTGCGVALGGRAGGSALLLVLLGAGAVLVRRRRDSPTAR